MAAVVYSLCLATACTCAFLLTRASRTSGIRLLFWSALCFWGLSFTNLLALVDLFVVPQRDLYTLRLAAGLASIGVLLYGMIWESK
jgi:hypothetical protein